MKIKYTVFITIFLLLADVLVGQEQALEYLKCNQECDAQIMELLFDKEVERIATKLMTQSNKEWIIEYLKTAEPGVPLKYDKRLGITEEEFNYFLANSQRKTQLIKIEDIKLRFIKIGDYKYRIDTNKENLKINNVIIDLKEKRITTDYAVLSKISKINQTKQDSPTGPWVGIRWLYEEINWDKMNESKIVKLSIGKLSTASKYILYYDVDIYKNGIREAFSVILYYAF